MDNVCIDYAGLEDHILVKNNTIEHTQNPRVSIAYKITHLHLSLDQDMITATIVKYGIPNDPFEENVRISTNVVTIALAENADSDQMLALETQGGIGVHEMQMKLSPDNEHMYTLKITREIEEHETVYTVSI